MIVELTGAPGSGKTTLGEHLRLQSGWDLVSSPRDLWQCPGRWRRLRTATGRVATESRIALRCILWIRPGAPERRLLQTCLPLLGRQRSSRLAQANVLRNIAFKILVRRLHGHPRSRPVLVDEGMSHLPQNLLVDTAAAPGDRGSGVGEIMREIALPSIVIFVETDLEVAIERVSARGHRRAGRGPGQLRIFLDNAVAVADATVIELERAMAEGRTTLIRVRGDHPAGPAETAASILNRIRELACTP